MRKTLIATGCVAVIALLTCSAQPQAGENGHEWRAREPFACSKTEKQSNWRTVQERRGHTVNSIEVAGTVMLVDVTWSSGWRDLALVRSVVVDGAALWCVDTTKALSGPAGPAA